MLPIEIHLRSPLRDDFEPPATGASRTDDRRLAAAVVDVAMANDPVAAGRALLGAIARATGSERLLLLVQAGPQELHAIAAHGVPLPAAPLSPDTAPELAAAVRDARPARRNAPLAVRGFEHGAWGVLPLGAGTVVLLALAADAPLPDEAVEMAALAGPVLQRMREVDEQVREATADLAEQNARLTWQSQEVQRANRLKSEFLANMSHELRTPINALIGYAALLLDEVLGDVNDSQRTALLRARASAEHLLALVNDILDLAKIEAGKMPLRLEPASIAELAAEVSQQIEPLVRKKHVAFVVDVDPACPVLHTDRTKVRQILLNLLSNAVKFTAAGEVRLTARPAGAGVRLAVHDTGLGIRREDLQAIWEDFRQLDQSRTREFGGTGLGLSITRKLIERLGGTVAVESTYGEGSTFTVYLPVSIPVGSDEERVVQEELDLPRPRRAF